MAVKALGKWTQKDLDFSARIESRMKLKRLNSTSLAKKVGFSYSAHYTRMNNPETMKISELREYIRILDIPKEEILDALYQDGDKK